MKIFWFDIKKPILALAPMAGYTDSAFRQICKEFGADLVYSEMASATALTYAPEKTLEILKFSKVESPYIVQLFGSEPEHFIKAVK
ncbi:MAG: tRNA-dihydrouridine synthase, partial [Patescibacteria group bacterium]